jgi:hypothetical protein
MKINRLQLTGQLAMLLGIISVSSCSHNSDNNPSTKGNLVKEWNVPISTAYENPAPAGRTETGTVQLQLFDNNTLSYHVMLNGNLAAGDAITAGHLHWGDPITNGPVILPFNPQFQGTNMASETVTIPRQSLADSIKTGTVYFNLHSTAFPAGLIRGQLDKTIDLAMDVPMTGNNENPPVTTTATGLALLRLTSDKTLYYKINIDNLEAGDAITAAHIHSGATGTNGPVIVPLATGAADIGQAKSTTMTDPVYNQVKNDPVYVNAHSVNHGAGIIRGQIR